MDVADRRHKRFEEALRRKLDCVVPRFHCRIASITMRKQAGFATNTQFAPINGITDHAERGRSCKPLRVTAAREREQKERQRIHCRHRPYNRQRSERTHLSNLLRYREPQRSSRRLKLAIHRFLKTGFCNAVPLAVLVMLGSVLPALRVPPGRVPTDLPSLPFVPLLARLPIVRNANKPAGGIKVDKIPRGYRAAEPEFIKHDSMDQPVAATVSCGPSLLSTFGSG